LSPALPATQPAVHPGVDPLRPAWRLAEVITNLAAQPASTRATAPVPVQTVALCPRHPWRVRVARAPEALA
jgi:hypothetical protein